VDKSPFKLPISYLAKEDLHELKPHVAADLELDKTMYPILLDGPTGFMQDLVPKMHRQYTTNAEYLRDTQELLANTAAPSAPVNETNLIEIYSALYKDPRFLSNHNYMEWTVLEYMNHSSLYLQIIAAVQLISPALSLMMPLLFVIFPIIFLLISGIEFTLSSYLACLKSFASNHFIGKMMSAKSTGYMITMCLLYAFQIYQNCVSCRRFYSMIYKVNSNLCELREFLMNTVAKMDVIAKQITVLPSYKPFLGDLLKHRARIQELLDGILADVSPIKWFMTKLPLMGRILYVNYTIHNSAELAESIQYSFGFEGWCGCISGISQRIRQGKLGMATILEEGDGEPEIVDEFYPPLMDSVDCVKNNCSLGDNMILTGINASGKTTYLKTTLLNVILTQQWGYGFYKACSLQPFHQIHSYLNIPDTSERDSLFQAESRRCKDILDSVVLGGRHFCIFDELYSGTNPDEASKSAYGFLRYLSKRDNVRFMLTTHYISVCKRLEEEECEGIRYLQMEVEEDGDDYLYTHRLGEGICEIQGGIQVLRRMEYPDELLGYIM
jgi:hypothetical protein